MMRIKITIAISIKTLAAILTMFIPITIKNITIVFSSIITQSLPPDIKRGVPPSFKALKEGLLLGAVLSLLSLFRILDLASALAFAPAPAASLALAPALALSSSCSCSCSCFRS